jgi:hypothetical protein
MNHHSSTDLGSASSLQHASRQLTVALALAYMAAVVQLTGCSDSGTNRSSNSAAAGLVGSCNNAASGFCNEFTGSSYKAASVQQSCVRQKMLFLSGTCPAAGRVGTCLIYKGKNTESRYRYYTNFPGVAVRSGAAAAAEDQCRRLKGEWRPL